MMRKTTGYASILSSLSVTLLTSLSPVSAQIVPDNTLPVNSQVTGCPVCLIEGGTVRGVNLFHSFEEFSVQTGGEAFFNNGLDIETILGRVTGTNISDIDGLIRANGTANLFLINPNGIVFGENARLDVGGSFIGSTANAIGFGNQGVFSATEPEAPPLLTVNPDVLFFNQLAAQGVSSIEVRGSLSVPSGESLLLVGGNVAPDATTTGELLIDGGSLTAPGGRVELAGVGAAGEVELAVNQGGLGLNFPADLARTDIFIFGSIIDVAEAGGGDIVIYARDLSIENSQIFAGIASGLGSVDAQAGDITIDATGAVTVTEGEVSNDFQAGAIGRGGDVKITAFSVSLTNGALISASTFGEGDAGKVVIRATDNVFLDGESTQGFGSAVGSTVESEAKGNSGGVEIESGSLSLTNGAEISASTFGEGDAGKVVIRATDSILLDGEDTQGNISGVFSQVDSEAKGNSGGVEIESGSLSLTNGAVISASTFGEGDAGKVVIRARDNVLLDGEDTQGFGSGVFNGVESEAKGDSGGVEIESGSLSLMNGAVISASTRGEGDAGKVVIRARDNVLLDGEDTQGNVSGVFNGVESEAKGDSGGVEIESGSLSLINGAAITASTLGEGDAGKVVIRATDSILLDGESTQGFVSRVLSTVEPEAKGDSGGVEIESGSLSLTNGAGISASTRGEGDAGKVVIRARDNVLLDGEDTQGRVSGVFSQVASKAKGDSGGVEIESGSLSLTNGAQITASTFGEGDAGKVVIRATDSILLNGESRQGFASAVFSVVVPGAKGDSGGVEIESGSLSLTNGAAIDASTGGEGDAGKVVIRATDSILLDGENSQGFSSGVFSDVVSGAKGNSGGVEIESGSLSLTNGARITAATLGEGDAGKVVIRATDSILLDGENSQGFNSGVASQVVSGAKGNSGGVEIESGSLSLTNGARITAATVGEGDAGKVVIRATDSILLDGEDTQGVVSAVSSGVAPGAQGDSGGVEIESGSLSVTNGARIDASTLGEGDAGKVVIRATDNVLLDGEDSQGFGSSIGSVVLSEAKGDSGGVEIESGSLSLTNGALISAETRSTGMAGDVRLNVTDFIQLSGDSAIRANATAGGPAGDLTIETQRITLDNGAEITVSSPLGQAGDLTITADSLRLNQGRILAETATSDAAGGANINLNGLELLLLENESLISANALEDANGGNVTIDARFIVATPPTGSNGSDITANAVRGNGGRVSVTTQGLFGIEFRDQLTPDNDITVSSEFGIAGNFELNQLGIDPSQGLIELPSSLGDASGQIIRRCGVAGNQNRGEFIVTGRGGLPISPDEPIRSESVLVDLGNGVIGEHVETLHATSGEHVETLHATSGEQGGNSPSPIRQIIEAQGWVRLPDGTIVLTANPPTVTSPLAEQPTDFCHNDSPSP